MRKPYPDFGLDDVGDSLFAIFLATFTLFFPGMILALVADDHDNTTWVLVGTALMVPMTIMLAAIILIGVIIGVRELLKTISKDIQRVKANKQHYLEKQQRNEQRQREQAPKVSIEMIERRANEKRSHSNPMQ